MKKKVLIFMLLFAFLVGVGVPDQAKAANSTETTADDVKYRDIEDFMHGAGYTDFVKNADTYYMVFDNGTYLTVLGISGIYDKGAYCCCAPNIDSSYQIYVMGTTDIVRVAEIQYYNFEQASARDNYTQYSNSTYAYGRQTGCTYRGLSVRTLWTKVSYGLVFDNLVYSDLDVYYSEQTNKAFTNDVTNLVYESNVNGYYDFLHWSYDAGLNVASSSNESPTVIPYSYNSYWHIVRKTSSGKWLLTTVGNSVSQENASDYTFVYSEDMSTLKVLNLYSGENTNGYLLNVRQYEYDTDGWKVRTYETYDARETEDNYIDLGAGSGVDDTRIIAYSSTDIYDEGFNLVTSTSTEYVEITDTPVVTPTTSPDAGSSGSGDSDDSGSGSSGGSSSGSGGTVVGGDANPGGMLDFLVTLATLVWTDLFAVEVPVDGYMISFQQIVIYGAVVGMLIWGGCKLFGKKG